MERMEHIKSMLAAEPKDEFLHYAMAQEYQKNEQYQEAIEWYNKLKELNPDYVGLYYHLAECLAKSGAKSEAMGVYDQGIEVAARLQDLHALSELKNARLNLEMDLT
ncbi:MAG: tetratricopeptide repeat protein [Saprospiraceae bacterium]|nr:tetratricopeptide repeat protein [Saprospiraceae bacterium]